MLAAIAQALTDTLYPPRCLACTTATATATGLCGPCWRETHFFTGPVCDLCGVSVATATGANGARLSTRLLCDSCTHAPPAWDRGRAAIAYEGRGRDILLSFKHGDRLDMAPVLADWIRNAMAPLIKNRMVIAPVPLQWRRMIQRRFNQSAELARHLARIHARTHDTTLIPDLLIRQRATERQSGNRAERHANIRGAIAINPRRAAEISGRPVLVIDDVLTSGATLSAATEALRPHTPEIVNIAVLARVARDG